MRKNRIKLFSPFFNSLILSTAYLINPSVQYLEVATMPQIYMIFSSIFSKLN
jgi:hypothetical protein